MMRTLTGSCKKNDNPVANKKNGDERTLELSQQEGEHIRPLLRLQEIRAIAGEPLPGFVTAQSLVVPRCWSISVPEILQNDGERWFIPIVERASLFSKVLSNSCGNLAIGHLVNCFDTDDASTKSFIRETFFELSLCLTGTK